MDTSLLVSLGKIAGIGGIAVGAVVLLIRPLIGKVGPVPAGDRAPLLRLIAIGAFAIGGLGNVAWVAGQYGGPSAATSGSESPAVVSGGNVSIGPAAPSPSQPAGPAGGQPATPPAGSARTQGNQSPAVVSGGGVSITVPPRPPQ